VKIENRGVLVGRDIGALIDGREIFPFSITTFWSSVPEGCPHPVRSLDGTAACGEDQNVCDREPERFSPSIRAPMSRRDQEHPVLDLHGRTVIPGHRRHARSPVLYRAAKSRQSRHFASLSSWVTQMTFSAPRLYLARRGSPRCAPRAAVETNADLNLKRNIDAGKLPGPHLDVTGAGILRARRVISYEMPAPDESDRRGGRRWIWARSAGVTSFKAYDWKHQRAPSCKAASRWAPQSAASEVTGAPVLGNLTRSRSNSAIDDLEHGFFVKYSA